VLLPQSTSILSTESLLVATRRIFFARMRCCTISLLHDEYCTINLLDTEYLEPRHEHVAEDDPKEVADHHV